MTSSEDGSSTGQRVPTVDGVRTGELVITKRRPSAFFGTDLANNQPVSTKYLHFAKKAGLDPNKPPATLDEINRIAPDTPVFILRLYDRALLNAAALRAAFKVPLAEEGRNALRQVRREANDRLKKMLKDHAISEDDERRGLDEVQKITDQHVAAIDELQKKKDAELLGK